MIESARRLQLEGARTWRRAIATGVDALACATIAIAPYASGVISIDLLLPPPDRFWPDHLLELVATNPGALLLPPVWFVSVLCLWHFCWLYFDAGRTPGRAED